MGRMFIDRPVFAIVISLFLVLTGALTALQLPVAQYPQIALPTVRVSAVYQRPQILVGLPSTLLQRRPDVAAAEANLHAATARVGVAQANRVGIPLIGLTGTLGMVSTALKDLFTSNDSGAGLTSFGPFAKRPARRLGSRTARSGDLA